MDDLRILKDGVIGIGEQPERVSGINKLAQQIAIHLVTTPGTDLSFPSEGGGVGSIIGANYGEPSEIFADIQVAVSNTNKQFKEMQRNYTLDADEKLQELTLIDVSYDEVNDQYEAEIQITASDETTTQTLIPLG